MFEKLKAIVERSDNRWGKFFDLFFELLITISVILYSFETIPEYSHYENLYYIVEVIIVFFFTIEYLLRILVADNKIKFIFSFSGLIDLFAILPFYLSGGSIGTFYVRIFRLFRLFKFLRYSKAVDRYVKAIASVKDELIVFSVATVFLLYLAAAGIYHFEHKAQPEVFKSIFHSLWWSIATLTTVGYGDAIPMTIGGRIFTFFILLIGIGFVSVPSALLASALANTRSHHTDIMNEVLKDN
jgi:voltage-gated potassium channel